MNTSSASNLLGFNHQSLIDLLVTLDSTTPVIPSICISYYMEAAGCHIQDPKVIAMVEASIRSKLHKVIQIARAHAVANGSITKGSVVLTTQDVEFGLAQIAQITQTSPGYFTAIETDAKQ